MAAINNREVLAQEVVKTLTKYNGMKLSELTRIYESSDGINKSEMEEFIQSMVLEHKLIEIEYTTDMFSVGMFLLPPNSRVNVRGVPPSPPRRI